ncbi:hypothetical protein DF947_19975 [Pedobacter paludis]|uniref:Uncharacterized protein n=2 Tax=Pedobacter paludis TaxID=2203212 RepID=A0A317EX94_9SPHI|nr:hypothetical protein DF947_19975 [Pedobacter paludis]
MLEVTQPKTNPMIKKLLPILFIILTSGCDNSIDRSLIKNKQKLNSPNKEFTLYRYFIKSSMAFGSGFTVIQIVPFNKNCDYSTQDFLKFGNNFPFWIKWKDRNTISVKCLVQGVGLQKTQPFKREVKQWKDWTIEIEYFSMYSSGLGGEYNCTKYSVDRNEIALKTNKKLLKFKIDEFQISMDATSIDINHFKTDYFNSKYGLSFTFYNITGDFNENDFIKQQAFIKIPD